MEDGWPGAVYQLYICHQSAAACICAQSICIGSIFGLAIRSAAWNGLKFTPLWAGAPFPRVVCHEDDDDHHHYHHHHHHHDHHLDHHDHHHHHHHHTKQVHLSPRVVQSYSALKSSSNVKFNTKYKNYQIHCCNVIALYSVEQLWILVKSTIPSEKYSIVGFSCTFHSKFTPNFVHTLEILWSVLLCISQQIPSEFCELTLASLWSGWGGGVWSQIQTVWSR